MCWKYRFTAPPTLPTATQTNQVSEDTKDRGGQRISWQMSWSDKLRDQPFAVEKEKNYTSWSSANTSGGLHGAQTHRSKSQQTNTFFIAWTLHVRLRYPDTSNVLLCWQLSSSNCSIKVILTILISFHHGCDWIFSRRYSIWFAITGWPFLVRRLRRPKVSRRFFNFSCTSSLCFSIIVSLSFIRCSFSSFLFFKSFSTAEYLFTDFSRLGW